MAKMCSKCTVSPGSKLDKQPVRPPADSSQKYKIKISEAFYNILMSQQKIKECSETKSKWSWEPKENSIKGNFEEREFQLADLRCKEKEDGKVVIVGASGPNCIKQWHWCMVRAKRNKFQPKEHVNLEQETCVK